MRLSHRHLHGDPTTLILFIKNSGTSSPSSDRLETYQKLAP